MRSHILNVNSHRLVGITDYHYYLFAGNDAMNIGHACLLHGNFESEISHLAADARKGHTVLSLHIDKLSTAAYAHMMYDGAIVSAQATLLILRF